MWLAARPVILASPAMSAPVVSPAKLVIRDVRIAMCPRLAIVVSVIVVRLVTAATPVIHAKHVMLAKIAIRGVSLQILAVIAIVVKFVSTLIRVRINLEEGLVHELPRMSRLLCMPEL